MPQKSKQLELAFEDRGEAAGVGRSVEAPTATRENERPGTRTTALMEKVCERPNLQAALQRVKQNKGSPGIDGMTVNELPDHLRAHWLELREQLLAGTYRPQAMKRVAIPKAGGGTRELGIPTVLDRFIQQAVLQTLQPLFDATFSEHSHGFRPGRSAHGAVREAREYVKSGLRWVVDVDLEKFFDRVNHDILMGRLAKRVQDKRLLRLIRSYLEAGMMADGVVTARYEGTPQGGPLSPLLANLLLDEVDKALERRGHKFVRYADDCNVYVRSKRAGERVLEGLRRLYGKLRLRVNESKTAVARVVRRAFLGFTFGWTKDRPLVIRVAPQSLIRLKDRIRKMTRRVTGRSMATICSELRTYLLGWKGYFRLAETPTPLRLIDRWIRHRLRAIQMVQWRTAARTRQALRARGFPELWVQQAASLVMNRRWWHGARGYMHTVLPNAYFEGLGLPSLSDATSTR